jgi:nitrogen fixation/metabolism regulation signal transduction histidine kinase
VVHNLIQNAQDASEPHKSVMLSTRWSPARKRVKLTVTDEGPGFAANILQRAFEPYVTTKAKGTGLGLAVVKKIADEHSARLDIANRLEEGVVKGAQVSLSFGVEKLTPNQV